MLSDRVPDLLGMRLLVAVREQGSLGAAGAVLGMSQQAASWRVRALERQVGTALVVRGPRGSLLTDHGRLVARWADDVLEAAARMDAGITALQADLAGHLDVAASLTVAEHLLPGWLIGLRDGRTLHGLPAVAVRLRPMNSDAVAEEVRAGRVPLGFVESPEPPAGLRSRTVRDDALVLAVPPDHPWARRRTVSARHLARTPLVCREEGSGTRRTLLRALTPHLPPGGTLAPPALEVPSAAAVRAAVVSGIAPGALSGLAVADDLALGRLVAVTVVDEAGAPVPVVRPLRAVWRTGRTPPAGAARDLLAVAAGGVRTPAAASPG
jgi:DNA-binding transcriptional LysR family regulator